MYLLMAKNFGIKCQILKSTGSISLRIAVSIFTNTLDKTSKNLPFKISSSRSLNSSPTLRLASITRINNQKLKQPNENVAHNSIVESKGSDQISTHVSGVKKVKQAAADVSYTAIILAGGALLVVIFYYLFSELFSRETPTGIYDESSVICTRDPGVIDALGVPIKVTAESGGRRVFQIKHKFFMENGVLFLIINYYLEGPRNKGTVHVKVKKNENTGKFEYEYIIVKLDQPHRGQYNINVKPN